MQRATIQLFLPSEKPVDVYLDGALAQKQASGKIFLEMVKSKPTPVRIVIQQSNDRTNVNATEVTVTPGELISTQLDLLE